MKKDKTLQELFSFCGFRAAKQLEGVFGDPRARIITLTRQKKRLSVPAAVNDIGHAMIAKFAKRVIWTQQITEYMYVTKDGVCTALGAKVCV